MDIESLKNNWNEWGKRDPMWGVLTWPDKKGNQWKPEEFFQTGTREIAEVLDYTSSRNIPLRFGKALDFGCGVGRLTQALAAKFNEVVGVDIAPSMIEAAIKYNTFGGKCTYLSNDSDDLKLFADNTFDFIYSNIVLQHMEPRYSMNYMKEFIRVLSPGGILIFQLPSSLKPTTPQPKKPPVTLWKRGMRFLRRQLRRGQQEEPKMEMYGIAKDDVMAFLNDAGGNVIDIRDDSSTGKWISFRYCVSKPHSVK